MPKRINKVSLNPTVVVALITTIGAIIGAYINYMGNKVPYVFSATQTEQAMKTALAITSTLTMTPTPTNQPRDWYVIFSLEFPAGYWEEGIHKYLFDADCPFSINSTKESESSHGITVKQDAKLQGSMVYIRRGGLYLVETFGTSIGDTIHPSQATTAIYGPFATSFDEAKRLHDECKVRIQIDDGEFMDLIPTRIDKVRN